MEKKVLKIWYYIDFGSGPDPDPHPEPDPHQGDADPHHWFIEQTNNNIQHLSIVNSVV